MKKTNIPPIRDAVGHGGGSIMMLACITARDSRLLFADDRVAGGRVRMNPEVYKAILSAHI